MTTLSVRRSRPLLAAGLLAASLPVLILSPPALAAEAAPAPGLEVSGLEVRVADLDRAVDFFKLYGFEPAGAPSADAVTVRNGGSVIDLVKVARKVEIGDASANTHINLRVDDLTAATAELRSRGGYQFVGEPRRTSPVGSYAVVKDPSGNLFHLMEPSPRPAEGIKRGIFNVGIAVTDMAKGREFYRDKLGFEIFSEDYYPPDLPFKRKGALPLVLHETAKAPAAAGYPEIAGSLVVLRATDLARSMADLKARGIRFLDDSPRQSARGRFAVFVDPFGNALELREAPPASH